MPKSLKGRIIVPSYAYQTAPDDGFMAAVNNVEKGMDGNTALNTPPFPIANLKSASDVFAISMAAAADGGKKAVSDKNKKRQDLAVMMRLLAHYVEIACNGDMTVFLSSGFQPKSTTPKPPAPLAVPSIVIGQGVEGQLLATVKSVPKALHYDVQEAEILSGNGAAPGTIGPYTTIMLTNVKEPVQFNNLKPGTIYTFQVRAYGKAGYTNWSPSVQRMCI
jgi:hypothetical protein